MIQEINDPTRQKIMDAAGEIFADQGFQAATVREICAQAGVNVAAVNYHFGDKAGLYVEVLRQSTLAVHEHMAADCAPEAALRAMIFGMCRKMLAGERPSWAFRLMAHEMAQPTPALETVIAQVIAPSYERMRKVLGAMLHLPPEHDTTRMCAHSIIAQIIHYVCARPVISKVWPELELTPERVNMLAEHIAAFSICSVKQIAKKTEKHAH